MNENTNPVDPGTNDAGEQPETDPGVEQTPDTAIRDAHLQTARDSYDGGQPLKEAAAWLVLQGHAEFDTPEKAENAILAD